MNQLLLKQREQLLLDYSRVPEQKLAFRDGFNEAAKLIENNNELVEELSRKFNKLLSAVQYRFPGVVNLPQAIEKLRGKQ